MSVRGGCAERGLAGVLSDRGEGGKFFFGFGDWRRAEGRRAEGGDVLGGYETK